MRNAVRNAVRHAVTNAVHHAVCHATRGRGEEKTYMAAASCERMGSLQRVSWPGSSMGNANG